MTFKVGLKFSMGGGGGGACGLCSRSRARREHAPRFPRFILIGSFSDTLLVVSILDMAYDCHL